MKTDGSHFKITILLLLFPIARPKVHGDYAMPPAKDAFGGVGKKMRPRPLFFRVRKNR